MSGSVESPGNDAMLASEKRSFPDEKDRDAASESRSENVVSVDSEAERIDFGGESMLPPPPTLTLEQEKKLWRKIDLRLMPILTGMYLFSFLDRGNIGLYKY
ncbi:hypothetical protein HGRIS_012527 [Hohenbuehelia grisea]|uniref:Uncharacterized protein n=1 Tax=Hohenbuehelia grisea TaxID=104357 RepID=A0ABR3ISS0_9AGAR